MHRFVKFVYFFSPNINIIGFTRHIQVSAFKSAVSVVVSTHSSTWKVSLPFLFMGKHVSIKHGIKCFVMNVLKHSGGFYTFCLCWAKGLNLKEIFVYLSQIAFFCLLSMLFAL